MPKQTTPQYPGKLGKRLPAPDGLDGLFSDEQLSEMSLRLALLFDHFGIPQPAAGHELDSWQDLAKALAGRHVPGFQCPTPPGPSKKWGEWQLVRLYIDVILSTREHKHGVSWACERLARKEPWKSLVRPGTSPESRGKTLRRKFYAIKEQDHRIVGIVERDIRNFPDKVDDKLRLAQSRISL